MTRTRVLACVLALLSSSCDDGLTQLVVVVSSDLAPGFDFERIEVTVTGADIVTDEARLGAIENGTFSRTFTTSDSDLAGHLPFSFGLMPRVPAAEIVTVQARALDDFGRVVVEQRHSARFTPGRTTQLGIALRLACVGVGIECTAFRGNTCEDGLCVPIAVDHLVRVVPNHELDGLVPPPTLAARLVQRSTADLVGVRELGEAPGGTFALGSELIPSVGPVNEHVSVGPFRIDAKEVTIGRFSTFLLAIDRGMRGRIGYPDGTERSFAAPTRPPTDAVGCGRIRAALDDGSQSSLPMTCIDWHTAQAFCVFEGGRLPTSAEWEYVAHGRGGVEGATVYPWGDWAPTGGGTDLCVEAWYFGCETESASSVWPQPVGALAAGFPKDGVGPKIYDLAGNVAEWTADRYESYADQNCWPRFALTDPSCPFEGLDETGQTLDTYVITRGGAIAPVDSADDGITSLQAAAIMPRSTESVSPFVGFRCVYDHLR